MISDDINNRLSAYDCYEKLTNILSYLLDAEYDMSGYGLFF